TTAIAGLRASCAPRPSFTHKAVRRPRPRERDAVTEPGEPPRPAGRPPLERRRAGSRHQEHSIEEQRRTGGLTLSCRPAPRGRSLAWKAVVKPLDPVARVGRPLDDGVTLLFLSQEIGGAILRHASYRPDRATWRGVAPRTGRCVQGDANAPLVVPGDPLDRTVDLASLCDEMLCGAG